MDVPGAYMDHSDLEDLDTDDDFNSSPSTLVDLETTPDDNSNPQTQTPQPPPVYQPQSQPNQSTSVSRRAPRTPLCTVCHTRPVYSTEGRQFTTCGLACASKVSMCRVCGIRPSYSNGSNKYPTCDLKCAAKLKSRANPQAQGGNSQTLCIVCAIRPSYSNGPIKYPTCGRTCAAKLPKLCDYCHKKPKAKNYPHCGLRCRDMAKSACLMCRSRPKNGRYHFCGRTCRENARKLAPLILEVPRGHTTFDMVENKFKKSWQAGQSPSIKKVYKVVEDSNFLVPYDKYLKQYGNEAFCYHGTRRSCQLGDDGQTKLCTSSSCAACSILKTSFQVSLANPGGSFGKGIYTSSASNKSAGYSSGVMFLNKVVMGNVHKVSSSTRSCPSGCQSVVYDMNGASNETVVYTNEAIRPVFLIIY